ncbi:MAG: response regulator [Firmicutes bacterium]|nr:response regulator [Bacillota bacterium]
METIRVLVADQDLVFQREVQDYLRLDPLFQCVGSLGDGRKILEKILKVKPHLLLLDVELPPEGGLPVLKQVRENWDAAQLSVIVISFVQNEAMLSRASRLGADYYLLRPFPLEILSARIKQLFGDAILAPSLSYSWQQVHKICIRYFDLLGVPPHYKGYRYLLEGVWLVCSHPEWLNSVTGKLYPEIGKRFNTSGAQVERAMRYALSVTWERGAIEHLYQVFPYESTESKGKPTNSVFIAKMADLVNLELSGP